VVVVDYADNLVPASREDYRHRVNAVWQGLRKISQERRCLLLTATQTDAASYEKSEIRLGNFSEDKRKYGHVTAIGTIDQDADEREAGEVRLGWLLLRRGAPGRQVVLRGDPACGRLMRTPRDSRWAERRRRGGEGEEGKPQ
jgi:replicative DNA helicase